MGRPPCCDRSNVKRGLWTAEEDAKILAYVAIHGTGNWTLVPKKAGLNRCGKSCRLRWTNYLRPELKRDSFTPQEEEIIINLHKAIGSRWSLIAKRLPGRTDNDVKNYWNTKLKKKLSKMGIDPVTHKPVSQVLSDYGNVSGLSNTPNPFDRNISHNRLLSKPETSSLQNEPQSIMIVMQPKPEFVQDNSSVTTTKPLWDLMAHPFQASIQPQFEVKSSCSSSTSSAITQLTSSPQFSDSSQQSQAQIIVPSSSFSWSEFLICDPTLTADPQQQQRQQQHESPQGMSSSTNSTLTPNEISSFNFVSRNEHGFNKCDNDLGSGAFICRANNGNQGYTNADTVSSSSSIPSSFVDAILSKDSEMSYQLFELLDCSFDY